MNESNDFDAFDASVVVPELLIGRAKSERDPTIIGQLLELDRNTLNLLAKSELNARLKTRIDASDIVQDMFLEGTRVLKKSKEPMKPNWLHGFVEFSSEIFWNKLNDMAPEKKETFKSSSLLMPRLKNRISNCPYIRCQYLLAQSPDGKA